MSFFEFFSPFFCPIYTGNKCEKQAKIHFLWSLNCLFEFSVFLVSELYVKKYYEIVENCFQGNLFKTNNDTKSTENSKKKFKNHKK
jgi:hypothetical protein